MHSHRVLLSSQREREVYLREWLTSFFMASREMAWPQDNLIGGLVSAAEKPAHVHVYCMPSYMYLATDVAAECPTHPPEVCWRSMGHVKTEW